MEHKHSVFDTDTHFVIDPVSRAIKIGENTKTTLVQTDHNSEVYTFDIPRIIDGHDTLLCNLVEVHYDNIDSATKEKSKGFYKVEDMKVSAENAEMLCFTWLIKEPATKYVGKIEFSIKFKCIEDGEVAYRWNTIKNKDLTVEASNDNSEVATEEPYPDIIGQWEESLFGIGDTEEQRLIEASAAQQAAIAAKGAEVLEEAEAQKNAVTARGAAVKASIPADYSALSALADHNRRNKAGAIVLDAEGESIVVNDASEYPVTGLKVFGKSEQFKTTGAQLFDAYSTQNTAFGSAEIANNGSLITVTAQYYVSFPMVLTAGESYYINFAASGDTANRGIRFEYPDKEISDLITNPGVFTPTADTVSMYLYGGMGTEGTVTYSNVQVNAGESPAEWEPYTGGVASPSPEYPQEINSVENAVIHVNGANLCNLPDTESTVINGVTWAYKGGAATANGTATAQSYVPPSTCTLELLPGTYTVSGGADGVQVIITRKRNGNSAWFTSRNGEYASFDVAAGDLLYLYTQVSNGETVSNVTVYPMVNVGEVPFGWEAYKGLQTVTIPHTLPGIPVSSGGNYTDANGQQWICDEVDLARGVYVQRIGVITLDDSLHYFYNTDNFFMQTDSNVFDNVAAWETRILSTHFQAIGNGLGIHDSGWFQFGGQGAIRFKINGVDTAEDFAEWRKANTATAIYPFVTPIETPLTDAEINAYKALCTNKPNTTILNDAGACMAVEYVADTKTYIDNKIAELMAK